MDLNAHKIAIVIALFNNEDEIARAACSAVAQKVPEGYQLDVIIVDDGSTDSSLEKARELAAEHAQITVLQTPQNGGPSVARNTALAATDAAWFTPLDSDDMLAPDRISQLIAHAVRLQADFVADNLLVTHASAPLQTERTLWPAKPEGDVRLDAARFVRHCHSQDLDRSELGFLKPLINRSRLSDPARPYVDDLRFGEDFELYTRLLLDGAAGYLVDPCGYYFIQRDMSASRSQSGADHHNLLKISRQFAARDDLSQETRAALRGHLQYSEKEMAYWALIDGVNNRDMGQFFSAFTISPGASLAAIGFLISHPFRKLRGRQTGSQ